MKIKIPSKDENHIHKDTKERLILLLNGICSFNFYFSVSTDNLMASQKITEKKKKIKISDILSFHSGKIISEQPSIISCYPKRMDAL